MAISTGKVKRVTTLKQWTPIGLFDKLEVTTPLRVYPRRFVFVNTIDGLPRSFVVDDEGESYTIPDGGRIEIGDVGVYEKEQPNLR